MVVEKKPGEKSGEKSGKKSGEKSGEELGEQSGEKTKKGSTSGITVLQKVSANVHVHVLLAKHFWSSIQNACEPFMHSALQQQAINFELKMTGIVSNPKHFYTSHFDREKFVVLFRQVLLRQTYSTGENDSLPEGLIV